MSPEVVFHRLVRRDMNDIRRYYIEEASSEVADRFYFRFLEFADRALSFPRRYHLNKEGLRRVNITGFPYHFLYRETPTGIRILILRHHKRHPSFGTRRK